MLRIRIRKNRRNTIKKINVKTVILIFDFRMWGPSTYNSISNSHWRFKIYKYYILHKLWSNNKNVHNFVTKSYFHLELV